jgi:hypothetical protein
VPLPAHPALQVLARGLGPRVSCPVSPRLRVPDPTHPDLIALGHVIQLVDLRRCQRARCQLVRGGTQHLQAGKGLEAGSGRQCLHSSSAACACTHIGHEGQELL